MSYALLGDRDGTKPVRTKDGDEDGSEKRKRKKRKDPNAPKKAMSGFMFFYNTEGDVSHATLIAECIRSSILGYHTDSQNIRMSNPGMAVIDVGRTLGQNWRNMTAEQKEPYEAMARADRKRYKEAMAGYKSTSTDDSGGDTSDSGWLLVAR